MIMLEIGVQSSDDGQWRGETYDSLRSRKERFS